MSARSIICLGSACWDTIFQVDAIPSHGKVLPRRMVQAASGMSTVAAIAIARLGGTVALWSRVGDDPAGALFLADLAREGLSIQDIRRVAGGRTSIATILVDAAGERLVVPYVDPGLDPDPAWLPLHAVSEAGAVMADTRWPEGARALLTEARRTGIPTLLDADVAPLDTLDLLVPLADHVLFSEQGLAVFSGSAPPEKALIAVGDRFGAEVVGVTLAERGALVRERSDSPGALRHVPALSVEAVDTLNAGDVWHGAYSYGLVEGWGLDRRVRFANVAAGLKCEIFGGWGGAPNLQGALTRMWQRGDE